MGLQGRINRLSKRLSRGKGVVMAEGDYIGGPYTEDAPCFEIPEGVTLVVGNATRIRVGGEGCVLADEHTVVYAEEGVRVVAGDRSVVYAADDVEVYARGMATVHADGLTKIRATDHAVARLYSPGVRALADESAVVFAFAGSEVTARGNAYVASTTARVTATDNVVVRGEVSRRTGAIAESVTRVESTPVTTTRFDHGFPALEWARANGVEVDEAAGVMYVFKGVRASGKSDSSNPNTGARVRYEPGGMPEAEDWDPAFLGCGRGLHFSPTQRATFDYASLGVRWFRAAISLADSVTLGDKVRAGRVVKPLVEIDVFGQPIS